MNQRISAFPSQALIIFARYPHVGQVKTRLAAALGAEWATTFYRCCAEKLFAESGQICCQRFLFCADEANVEMMQRWAGPHFLHVPQSEGNLGDRMVNAFDYVFNEGYQQIVIVGTDIPDLTAAILHEAFARLDQGEVVIGPTYDGGYYLLGMRRLHRELFTHIAWSTDTVFEQTMQLVDGLGLQSFRLPMLRDIDTEEDLQHWTDATPLPFRFQPLLVKLSL